MLKRLLILSALMLLLAACISVSTTPAAQPTSLPAVPTDTAIANGAVTSTATTAPASPTSTSTAPAPATATVAAVAPDATVTPTALAAQNAAAPTAAGPTPTLSPDAWQDLPVIPTVISKRAQLIYQMGLLNGNNPQAYSKVGDCNMTLPAFMGDFDTPGKYKLAEYTGLQNTIDYFAGSHSRKSLAAKDGLTAHAVLSMLWVDWKECQSYDTPLTCEYRLNKPMYAFISFGTNDANGNVDFDKAMRRVIDMTIGNGTIPILVTKADNAEGDNSLNRTTVALAYEYGLPVWNFWAAVQPLPNHGLKDQEHMEHLSESPQGFTNFEGDNLKQYAWPVRNLTALEVLKAVREGVEQAK